MQGFLIATHDQYLRERCINFSVIFFTSEHGDNSKHDTQSEVSDNGSFLAKGLLEKFAKEGKGQGETSLVFCDALCIVDQKNQRWREDHLRLPRENYPIDLL